MTALASPLAPRRHSLLVTAHDGPQDSPIWLVFHARHGDIDTARRLGESRLPPMTRRIAIRSARTQTRGSIAPPKGHFWFIGSPDKPELMTLADGLYQLDLLADELCQHYARQDIHLLGEGEGASMAFVFGLMRADITREIRLENAELPDDLARIPLDFGDGPFPKVALIDHDRDRQARNIARLTRFGIDFQV